MRKFLAACFCVLAAGWSAVLGQTVAVTPSTTTYAAAGGTVTLNVTLNYTGTMNSVAFQIGTVPAGWTFQSASGTSVPQVRPAAGATQAFEFAYTTAPAAPATFTITVAYAASLQGEQRLTGIAGIFRVAGETNARLVSAADVVFTPDAVQPPVAPTITSQPSGAALAPGQSTLLTVVAAGTAPITYQWRKDAAAISGATNATLALNEVTTAQAGNYSVVVANGAGSITSATAIVTVSAPATAPQITAAPVDRTVAEGGTATFSVAATGTAPLSYQWSKDGAALAGATQATLTLTNVTTASAGLYAVTIANAGGSASASARLTVTAAARAPEITTPPAAQTATVGSSAIFTVTAAGTAPLSYQWTKDGAAVAGATGATLTLTNVQTASAGSYAVVVTNSAGSATSAAAVLTITTAAQPPKIVTPPVAQTVPEGGTATFSVGATGAAPLAYQWRKDGAPLAGATGATLAIANAQASHAGSYSVVVTNAAGSATSIAAVLTVTPPVNPGRMGGAWVGALDAGAGSFALLLRADGTGVLLAYLRASRIALVGRELAVDAAGKFSGRAAASNGSTIDVQGEWRSSGAISGSIGSVTFSAAAAPAGGATAALAGFYQAGAAGRSATCYVMADTVGAVFGLTIDGANADAGRGALQASGGFEIATESAARLTGTVEAATGRITLHVATAGATTAFAGANNDARVDVEKLINISTRAPAGGAAGALIAGFVITGDQPKQVLVRAIGPTLASFGVGDPLAAARLEVVRDGATLAAGGDWSAGPDAAAIAAAAVRLGAFALPDGSRDAALLLRLTPGAYTAVVTGQGSAAGNALVEVYDATEGAIPRAQRISNISTRAGVGAESALIAGFVIRGEVPKRVLLRGAGPALAAFGVPGTLAAPQVKLFSGESVLAQNSGWSGSPDAVAIAAASASVGAFAFPNGSADAALIVHLTPGAYTAQVSGVGGATGVALLEVYELP